MSGSVYHQECVCTVCVLDRVAGHSSVVHLLTAAPTGGLVVGQLFLHTGGLVHLLWVKRHAAQRAEGRGDLETRLQTLPTEPAHTHTQRERGSKQSYMTGIVTESWSSKQ